MRAASSASRRRTRSRIRCGPPRPRSQRRCGSSAEPSRTRSSRPTTAFPSRSPATSCPRSRRCRTLSAFMRCRSSRPTTRTAFLWSALRPCGTASTACTVRASRSGSSTRASTTRMPTSTGLVRLAITPPPMRRRRWRPTRCTSARRRRASRAGPTSSATTTRQVGLRTSGYRIPIPTRSTATATARMWPAPQRAAACSPMGRPTTARTTRTRSARTRGRSAPASPRRPTSTRSACLAAPARRTSSWTRSTGPSTTAWT